MLQRYKSCPFRYFAEYVARAARVIAQDDPSAQGTLLHRLMELATRDLADRLRSADTAEEIDDITLRWRLDLDTDYMRKLYEVATADRGLGWYARPSYPGASAKDCGSSQAGHFKS